MAGINGDKNGDGRWTPRWWVAVTTVLSFGLGMWCAIHEILSISERPATLTFCATLIGLVPVAIMLERLRK